MSAHGIPGDLLEHRIELRFVVVAHVFEQFEGTGHRKSDWAFAIDDGEVAVAGQDLQRCLRVPPVVAEAVGLGFEAGGFACRLMAGSSERSGGFLANDISYRLLE